jgi:hypothetical protein
MASPLKKAKDRLRVVQQQISALRAEESDLETTVRVLERMKFDREFADLNREIKIVAAKVEGELKRDPNNRIIIAHAVSEILADGKPRRTPQLVESLEKKGVPIAGKNKVAFVSQILSREKTKFLANRKTGWTLRSMTVVPIGKSA